jgi:hypothetical protein
MRRGIGASIRGRIHLRLATPSPAPAPAVTAGTRYLFTGNHRRPLEGQSGNIVQAMRPRPLRGWGHDEEEFEPVFA